MYEYKTIKTKGKIGILKKDIMESLGYEICEAKLGVSCFRRDYELSKNEELKELEANILNSCDIVSRCENKRKNVPNVISIIFGVIACLVMGGGMSLYMAYDYEVIGIIVGVIGMLLMIPPYFIYKGIYEKNNCKVMSKINEEYDKINVWSAKALEIVKSDVK